jgi:dihydrolipoamide dehydrogenase
MQFDVIVIGSGPGGYVAAIKAAQLGFKTACIEKYPALGGACLNVGCIPSKSLLHSSELYYKMTHEAKEHGIECKEISLDFPRMMEKKKQVVQGFNVGIEGLFKKNKVEKFYGKASFISPHEIKITHEKLGQEQTLSAKYFIIATGSKPTSLPFLPFDGKQILSSTEMLSLASIPKTLLVIGAGIIGVELGSVYARLGSDVVFLEFLDKICPTLDQAVSKALQASLEKQGLKFLLGAKVTKGAVHSGKISIEAEIQGTLKTFDAERVLVAVGRKPYTEGLGLETLGITLTNKGMIPVDDNFRTAQSHIFAIGDVIEGPMLAHKAEEEGIAVAEILAGQQPSLEYMTIPSVVYTYPEVACVGLSEEEAKAKGLSVKIAQFPLKANSRAGCTGEGTGMVKMIADADSLQILGVHIMAPHAGELITEGVLAMTHRMSAKEIAHSMHAHPTFSEALKEVALMLSSKAIHL